MSEITVKFYEVHKVPPFVTLTASGPEVIPLVGDVVTFESATMSKFWEIVARCWIYGTNGQILGMNLMAKVTEMPR